MPTLRPRDKWDRLLRMLQEECREGDEIRVIFEPGGYWNVVNNNLPADPRRPFLLFQDDTDIAPGFLETARNAWLATYPDGVGLIALNDGIVDHGGACYALTTKIWLYVLFGKPRFPSFWHHYLDTLLGDRSKDLGRYTFLRSAVCRHMHHSVGLSEWDDVYAQSFGFGHDDFGMKNRMDCDWYYDGERERATARMQKVSRQTRAMPVPPPVNPATPKTRMGDVARGVGQWVGAHLPYRQSINQSCQSKGKRR